MAKSRSASRLSIDVISR